METYEFSKLRSFLTLTRFVMEDTLRFLVDDSLAKFVSFITGCCRSPVRSHTRGESFDAPGQRSKYTDLALPGDST